MKGRNNHQQGENAPCHGGLQRWQRQAGQRHSWAKWSKRQREEDSGWKSAPRLFEMLNKKREFFQPFPETYWYKNICPIKFPLIFKFCHAEIRAFCTKSVFSLPFFFPAYNRWFFYFSWRIWLHPALAGAQLGEKVTSPSSAVPSHHHLPGKNWHPFKSPAVNPSADCSLTWFSQTHQVQLKHVNICLSKAPTQCWSRPGSCQPQPFPPLPPYLPTRDQHVLRSACHFNCCVFSF